MTIGWHFNNTYSKLSETFKEKYKEVNDGGELWENLNVSNSNNYDWPDSTYIKKPPYMKKAENNEIKDINLASPIVLLGDSVTTDHISPSSVITKGTAAWDYLTELGIDSKDFNNYLTRRANHEIVARSTFASLRLRNLMTPNQEGSLTVKYPENKVKRLYEVAMEYKKENKDIIVIAGENYGWPLASYGINYIGTKFTDKTSIDGMVDPIHFWVPSIAPSGMVYVDNPNYPSLNQSILIGSLKFQYLHQCVIKDGKVVEEKKLFDQIGRVRSVELDKDKNIFVGVENLGIIKLIE